MIELELDATITVCGPFNTRGLSVGEYGVDAVLLRDDLGRAVIPGSQVKGRLRDSLEEIQSAISDEQLQADILEWFGPAVQRDDIVDENSEEVRRDTSREGLRRHPILISDFTSDDSVGDSNAPYLQTRIEIDSDTGAVKNQAMLVAESAVRPGEMILFNGSFRVSGPDLESVQRLIGCVYRGLLWITNFGAFRTVGFGVVEDVRLTPQSLTVWDRSLNAESISRELSQQLTTLQDLSHELPVPIVGKNSASQDFRPRSSWNLRLRFSDAFCVGKVKRTNNYIETEEYVSGAVLKGAVAYQLQRVLGLPPQTDLTTVDTGRFPNLCRNFNKVRFLAAFPTTQDNTVRPVRTPLSFVKGAADNIYRDVALIDGPFLFKSSDQGGVVYTAPSFRTDWKDDNEQAKDDIKKVFNPHWKRPTTEYRVRTAIDPRNRRFRNQYLFGQKLNSPHETDWLGRVDLRSIPAVMQSSVSGELQELLEVATLSIGKTKARCKVTFEEFEDAILDAQQKYRVIVLQSPALMANPDLISAEWKSSSPDPLRSAYEDYFRSVSNDTVRLIRFFSQQSLQGGYLGHRIRTSDSKSYTPFYLTDPCSVFVVTAENEVGVLAIEEWGIFGLPQPQWAIDRFRVGFQHNPFRREDGFGEVLIDHPCHRNPRLTPKNEEIERLS